MAERFICTGEWEEYCMIADMFREKMKELRELTNVIKNTPHIDVVTDDSIIAQGKLYRLDYSAVLSSIGFAEGNSIYSFNLQKLEQIKKAMKALTVRIQNKLREHFGSMQFEYHSPEVIEKYIARFGYSGSFSDEEPTITEHSEYISSFYQKETTFRPNRHNRKKLKAEHEWTIGYHEVSCSRCGDGGCPSCEPWFFM